jgi:hypothetical protein
LLNVLGDEESRYRVHSVLVSGLLARKFSDVPPVAIRIFKEAVQI